MIFVYKILIFIGSGELKKMDIVNELKTMIEEELLDNPVKINEETSLFNGQILDSLKLTMLVAFIEDTYEIKVKSLDIIYENFDTINNMKEYIEKNQ